MYIYIYIYVCICLYIYIYMCICIYFFVVVVVAVVAVVLALSISQALCLHYLQISLIQAETLGVYKETQNHMSTEEITLESTPPLKRIHTPPSMKALFALNQCKFSFHKLTANSIKTQTSQYNKNITHNLSDHKLTEDELSILTKGLSFVPTPTKNFKQDTNIFYNKFKTRILTQYFFSQ